MLDKVNSSDLAFAVLVFENYHSKWVHEIETERELDLKLDQRVNCTSVEETDSTSSSKKEQQASRKRKRYTGPPLPYTQPPTRKMGYLESGWTTKALNRLQSLQEIFDGLLRNKDVWQKCKESWDEYIGNLKQLDGHDCWVPIYTQLSEDDNEDNEEGKNGEGIFDFVLGNSF